MKIKKLQIDFFRHIKNTEIIFGDRITVISGQNGTGKSSILGWIAQLCDYKKKKKRLNGKPFKEDFKNIFRFCPNNDFINEYKLVFSYCKPTSEIQNEKIITTRHQQQTHKSPERYRTDFDGRGKALDYPIIYLGLRRLIPLATEKNIVVNPPILKQSNIKKFSSLSKEILLLMDDNIEPESIKSVNKSILAMKTKSYSHLGNSAGQDNIGQIIDALLSFKNLKSELKDGYEGGIILIDEIDATLYAASQIKLIDKLYRFACDLNLQIIFTTHSLEILEYYEDKLGNETKINYLVSKDGNVENIQNPSFNYISNKIKNQIQKTKQIIKKLFICEDEVAEYWIRNLLNGSDLKQMVRVEKGPFGDGNLIEMAKSRHTIFKDAGFILDGDMKKKHQNKKLKKVAFLPGVERPETVFYKFIKNLPDNDEFWIDKNNFTRQTCFSNYMNSSKGTHKKWFLDEDNKINFGRGYSRLLNRWKKDNKKLINDFHDELRHII